MNDMVNIKETGAPIQLNKEERKKLREEVHALCQSFGNEYWRKLDVPREYPYEFVEALTKAGYLSILIPQVYGGKGSKPPHL